MVLTLQSAVSNEEVPLSVPHQSLLEHVAGMKVAPLFLLANQQRE